MHYCGLDVSRKSTHVYIEDAQGRRVTRGIVATTPTGLAGAVERYTARGVRVAIEAGNQTAWIVDLLRELGAKVHVVHPLSVAGGVARQLDGEGPEVLGPAEVAHGICASRVSVTAAFAPGESRAHTPPASGCRSRAPGRAPAECRPPKAAWAQAWRCSLK